MPKEIETPEALEKEETVRLIFDMCHRIMIHHGLWFTEVKHQMGMETALDTLEKVFQKSFDVQIKRLSKVLGFKLKNGLPEILLNMSKDSLDDVMNAVAVNWLANDGLWFQEVEFSGGMTDAKRCNDSCWAHFSPFEARSIMRFLKLPEHPGLEGLKKALNFRLYGRINSQSFADEKSDSFVFQMNECRVQTARKRKGLDDYPCKSVGMVEYPYFAGTIDNRIRTECIGCPPDKHPDDWYCAWRFTLD
ncbi:MAG: cytosolic protein [Proteobacteria bacterium]|nr:cytosolic protein [Pseudomonadota bacterium]